VPGPPISSQLLAVLYLITYPDEQPFAIVCPRPAPYLDIYALTKFSTKFSYTTKFSTVLIFISY
jgi:hypothetical protein